MRAFDAGWGGAVWKTLGEPIVNVSSRYGAVDFGGQRMMGLNNIELITDRPLEVNLREIARSRSAIPKHAVIASLMVESQARGVARDRQARRGRRRRRARAELRLPARHERARHGRRRRPGARVHLPDHRVGQGGRARPRCIVKLTPNVTDVTCAARAAKKGGADAVSLINTINSIIGVDLDTLRAAARVGGRSAHGGYCGPAVKPIALHMVLGGGAGPGTCGCRSPASAASSTWCSDPMSNVRFTNDILSRQTLFDLGNITDKLAKTQNELSTGKRIQQPEDDPYGAGRAVTLRNELADVQQYQTNINDASAWAQTTDSALGNVTDLLQRARELVVQAANGTQDQSSLERDLVRDDADQGVAAGAGERDVQRALHLLRHGDEHPAVPVQRLRGHHAARPAADRARPGHPGQQGRAGGIRRPVGRPAGDEERVRRARRHHRRPQHGQQRRARIDAR